MVGFGKRMADTQVPEWSTEYVPYKVMKKHLKRLVQRMTAEERQMTERGNLASSNGSNDGTRQQLLDGTADAGVRPQLKREVKSDRDGLITVRTTSTDAFNHDDHADKARNRHRRQPSSETNELRIATTVVAPKDENVLALEEEVQFFHLLDEALRRVVSFYSDRLDHIRGEAQREQLRQRVESRLINDAFEADDMKLPDATNADAFTGADATLPVTAAMRATLPLSLRSSSRLSRTKGLAKRRVFKLVAKVDIRLFEWR